MDDCISRQAVIDEIDEWIKAFRENGHKESAADACLIQDGIIQLPSAQPEIIWCKDCKKAPKCYGDVLMKSKGGGYIYCPVEYCSEAERRTNETTI